MKHLTLALFLFSTILGCKEDPKPEVMLPSNLVVKLALQDGVPGRVNVIATAVNENFYTIIFNDGLNTETKEVNDGKASHTYGESGTYVITVRAHALAANFIESNDTIVIHIDPTTTSDGRPLKGYATPLSQPGYSLVWNDEFEGSSLNENDWNFEIGAGGWGNSELQYYRKENTTVKDGFLSIEAKKQSSGSSIYTSSRLTTKGKRNFKYGRVDIRAALPEGQGMWPALWMLGENISSIGWPACGEIDIMEMIGGTSNGRSDRTTHGTIHWEGNNKDHASYGTSKTIAKKLSEEFHVYSIVWDANSIKWYFDDVQFNTADIKPSSLSEFHENFFFIMNVAVGGDWPGSPDETTVFPQKMWVDYIRMYQ
jgi:beta-glucanase (GH16 family)